LSDNVLSVRLEKHSGGKYRSCSFDFNCFSLVLYYLTLVNTFDLAVKRLTTTAKLPSRAYPTDSGLDLFSDESIVIPAFGSHPVLISTGIAIALEQGYEGQIRPKSGLSSKGIMAAFGSVDNSYIGELKVVVYNFTDQLYTVDHGQKIAQLVITPVFCPAVKEIQSLSETDRGSNGFGSTGLK
jgi:dUTP pyrophosphatase